MPKPVTLIALVVSLLASAAPAAAITIAGIEFVDPVVFDIAPGANATISTSEDLYVFAPNDLIVANLIVDVGEQILVLDALQVIGDTISLCTLGICELGPLDLDQDVVVRIFDPVGDLDLSAGGSAVLSRLPIPEPGTLGLVALGLLALARRTGFPTRR